MGPTDRKGVGTSSGHAGASRGTALATLGLAAVLTLLTGVCTWVALDASRSSDQATGQLRIASAQEAVLEAALAEHAAQLRYLECPLAFDPTDCTARERRAYEESRRRLAVALGEVEDAGEDTDRSGAAYVTLLERRYDLTVKRQFAAIDDGRERDARRLEREATGPEIEQLLRLVRQDAENHQANAAAGIGQLGERTQRSADLIPAVFGVAFLLLGGCWAVLVSLQRRLRRQTRALGREKALLDGVLSAIPHQVYWKDAEGRIQGMNRAFVEQRAGEPERGGLPTVLAELEQDVSRTRAPVTDRPVEATGADGRLHQLLISVIPRAGAAGAAEGVIGVGTDVTHVRALEHQLAQAQRLESIGQLASGIAHEINTPVQFLADNTEFVTQSVRETLTALRGIAGLLERPAPDPAELRNLLDAVDLDYLEEELPEALSESRSGLQRVAEIVRAMKDFAQPGQGRQDTDLNAAIDSIVTVSRAEWQDVAAIDLDLDPGLGLVPCQAGEIKQVLLNVVVNAVQAIAEGRPDPTAAPGQIRISTRREASAVRITVTDDGPGMTEEVRQRVFDPFFTTKDVGKGRGQGLALAHATIVRKHGGTIELLSRPGAGTTCVITLPAGPSGTVSTDPVPADPVPADTAPADTAPADMVPTDPVSADVEPEPESEPAPAGNHTPAVR